MIGILSNRIDDVFLQKLNLPFALIDDVDNLIDTDGLFIDWVPKIPVNEDAWMKQASLLQAYIKKEIPIVIFDRSFSLTEKEVDWVKKFNTYLFEPALNSNRMGFDYLPEWISNFEILFDDEDREYDLVYSHYTLEINLKEFERWFRDYARLFPEKKVAYSTFNITDFKKEEYKNNNLIYLHQHHPIHSEGIFSVCMDTEQAYKIGYFNISNFFMMNLGCLPLLPIEHKYFHSMFKNLIVSDVKELDYYVSLYGKAKNVIIEEIFDNIKSNWPEFTVDHAVNIIRNCYE